MITDKIKALFQFIEFLHSNIENFNQYDEVVKELRNLGDQRKKLYPENNFEDTLKYNELQAEIKEKFKVINENVHDEIKSKAVSLNICKWDHNLNSLYNWNIDEINNLKKNFKENDVSEILQFRHKYIEFREKTTSIYFLEEHFFSVLDGILRQLFVFFKDKNTNQSEFEAFETKAKQANDIREAVELFRQGYKKITLPNNLLSPSKVQQNYSSQLPPPPIAKQKDTLSNLITHKNSNEIVESIKIQYKNIKGKRLKLLLLALQDLGLLPKERIAQKFHNLCKNEFDWDIASYNAMNGYNFNLLTDNDELNKMKQYLKPLIKTK